MKTLFTLALVLTAGLAQATEYTIDYANSHVNFSGTHAGNAFNGKFEDWQATIVFDPNHLAESKLEATFQTASAKTGNAMYDGTLPKGDWFDVKNHPTATFTSESIEQTGVNQYLAQGTLTIKEISQPVALPFKLTSPAEQPVTAMGTVTLNRLDFNIGKQSDPKADWVGETIEIDIKVTATAQ